MRASPLLARGPALIIALALAACARQEPPQEVAPPPEPATHASPYATEALLLKFRGRDAREVLATEGDLGKLLDEDLKVPPGRSLDERIRAALENPPDTPEFSGLGAVQVGALLEAALASFDGQGRFASELAAVEVVGHIQPFVIRRDGTPEVGFRFDDRQRSGHLWVEMRTISTAKDGSRRQFAEMLRVEIAPGGFEVEPRAPETPLGVFPDFGARAFPVSAAMATNADGVPFGFKLWAVGPSVKVTDYWSTRTFDPDTDTALYAAADRHRRGDPGLPQRVRRIFQQQPQDCVDMMFVRDPSQDMPQGALLAGYLPSTVRPPQYCLGRCTNPPIVNTK